MRELRPAPHCWRVAAPTLAARRRWPPRQRVWTWVSELGLSGRAVKSNHSSWMCTRRDNGYLLLNEAWDHEINSHDSANHSVIVWPGMLKDTKPTFPQRGDTLPPTTLQLPPQRRIYRQTAARVFCTRTIMPSAAHTHREPLAMAEASSRRVTASAAHPGSTQSGR